MVKFFSLSFNEGHTATAATISETGELPDALEQMGLVGSHPILVIVGGASQMSEADFVRIQSLFVEVLAPIAQRLGAYIVDGGTDAGVIQLIGNARHQINAQFPLIGVVPTEKVILPNQTESSDDAALLEPHHTHFILVPGNNWGDESAWIVQVATMLAGGAPSVTMLINGGEITFLDAANSVIAGRLVMVIAGSGRTAVEEGRRQRAEGTFSLGIQTPTNCKHRIDGGVLYPSSVRSQAEGGGSIPFCPLPFLINLPVH